MRFVVLLLVGLLSAAPVAAQNRVVLVASKDSPIETLSSFEVRKIYLGITVFKDGRAVRALRNLTDQKLNDVFLQSVVGLSEERYERRLLTNVFKFGTARPEEYSNAALLARALQANPYAVTYLWVMDDNVPEGLKVLRVLWQEF
jgi:hypothetical protein